MLDTIDPVERRALAIVAVQMLISLGMLGVVLPTAGTPERDATGPTPYSAEHAAIAAQATQDQTPTF